MTSRFTPAAQNALKKAQTEASEMGHTYIGTEHLLLGLLSEENSVGAEILRKHGLDYKSVKQAVIFLNGSGNKTLPPPSMTPRLRSVIENAAKEMPGAFGRIGTEQLLSALLNEKEGVAARIIEKHKTGSDILPDLYAAKTATSRSEERKKLPPTVAKYGKNLCDSRLDPVIGREGETEALIEALCRRRKNNPCLIGEAGVGKTAVVEGLASRIKDGNVPSFLLGKAIVSLDIAAIISGAKYRGEFEERMKTVLLEASEDPDIILFIDELHTIVGTGASEGAIDAGSIMKPSLARGEIRLIGATTVSEYRRHIESDPALERRFLPITVEEPTVSEAVNILTGIKEKYEEHHGIIIDESAIEAAVELSVRYLPSKRLPDKAIDLLDEAASAKRIEVEHTSENERYLDAIAKGLNEADTELSRQVERNISARLDVMKRDGNTPKLTRADIEKVLKKRRGSVRLPSESDLLGLENALKDAVFGQKSAIKTVSSTLRAGILGINGSTSPIASMMFLGPSGVGKTALATAIAEQFYGNADALIRLDMSEYGEKHSVSRLIGSPPGYVGYRDEGLLVKEVRSKPYSVVLFDEAEKADPDVFSLLLQILDHGFITDAQGKRADFRGCVIILTSNVGSTEKGAAGFTAVDGDKRRKCARDFFSPELIGRLDCLVTFDRLDAETAHKIAEKRLCALCDRLSENGLSVEICPEVIDTAAKCGSGGARDIYSFIKTEVEGAVISNLPTEKDGVSLMISCENEKIFIKNVTKNALSHIM